MKTNHFKCDICHRVLCPTGIVQGYGPSDPPQSEIRIIIGPPRNLDYKLADCCEECTYIFSSNLEAFIKDRRQEFK
jgi:hypothetical protein